MRRCIDLCIGTFGKALRRGNITSESIRPGGTSKSIWLRLKSTEYAARHRGMVSTSGFDGKMQKLVYISRLIFLTGHTGRDSEEVCQHAILQGNSCSRSFLRVIKRRVKATTTQ